MYIRSTRTSGITPDFTLTTNVPVVWGAEYSNSAPELASAKTNRLYFCQNQYGNFRFGSNRLCILMSTFPTAFWKKQPAKAVGDLDATFAWETGLAWSYTTSDPNEGFTAPFPVRDTNIFPFSGRWRRWMGSYNRNFTETMFATTGLYMASEILALLIQVYYGWYLTGGPMIREVSRK